MLQALEAPAYSEACNNLQGCKFNIFKHCLRKLLTRLRDFLRVFLNLWFGKPMVCVRVAFHENDGNHENDENDEDNSDSYKQGVECWIRGNHGNHENDENHENPGCKP